MLVSNSLAVEEFSQLVQINSTSTKTEEVCGVALGDEKVYERLTAYEETKGRISAKKLKDLRRTEPMAHNAVNCYGLYMQGCQLVIETTNEAYKKTLEAFYDGMNQQQYHGQVASDIAAYGRSPWEIVWNVGRSKPVFLAPVPIEGFDYWREKEGMQGKIQVDKNTGEPVAYSFKPSDQMSMQDAKRIPEANDKRPKEHLLHLYQFNIQDGLWGLGVLEPTFKAFRRKQSIEVGIANNVYRHGWSKFAVSIGDEVHKPTATAIASAKSKYKRFNERSEFILPYYHKLAELHPAELKGAVDALDHAIDQIASGTGVPKKHLMGSDANTPLFAEHGGMLDAFYGKAKSIADAIIAHDEDYLVPLILGLKWSPGEEKPADFPRLKLEPVLGKDHDQRLKEMELALKYHIRDREWVASQMKWEGDLPAELNPASLGTSPGGLSALGLPLSGALTSELHPQRLAAHRTLRREHGLPQKIIDLQDQYGEQLEALLKKSSSGITSSIKNIKNLAEDVGTLRKGGIVIDLELEAFNKAANSVAKAHVADATVLTMTTILSTYPELKIPADKIIKSKLASFFEREQLDLIKGLTEKVRGKMKERLGAGMIAGKSEAEIATDLSLVSDKSLYNLRTIARTETKRVYDGIAMESYKEAGVEMVEYVTAGDDRVRPSHSSLNGQRWPINSPNVPRDILSEPNCRCILIPVLEGLV